MPTCNSRTVLLVEDDQDLLALIAMMLEAEGYHVRTAANGLEALEDLERGLPDLILLDMKMPVMDGWTFAREFHLRYGFAAPIVIVTAAENARKYAQEVGAAGWLGKPFDLDALVAAVARYIRTEMT